MAFGGLILTNAGRNLLAAAQLGGSLTFTHAAIGDGTYAGSYNDITKLVNSKVTVELQQITISEDQVSVDFKLSNKELTEGYYLREIGLFAKTGNGQPVLYAYDNSGADADYIPAGGGAVSIERVIRLVLKLSDVANVTIDGGASVIYATQADLMAHTNNADIHITVQEKAKWDAKETPSGAQKKADAAKEEAIAASDSKGSAAAVRQVLDSHIGNQSNPHKVTAVQVGADPAGTGQSAANAVQGKLDAHTRNSGIHVTATQKSKWDGYETVRTLTHVKSGVNHELTGLNGAEGLLSCQFKATAGYNAALDTLTVDGVSYTIKLSSGEKAEDNLFVSGAIVSCIVDTSGKTVNFKAAGGQKLPAGTTAIVKTFTANGTFTVPQTGKYRVTVFGKGGNGSDSYATSSAFRYNGTGGGAGGIAVSILSLAKGDAYPVTVTGSTSSFGSLLSAAAGKDGSDDTAGTGGAAAGGNLLAENGENGTAGDGAYPWGGGAGGGYSANAVSMSPFASDSGGTGGDSASVSSGSREPGKTQKLTGYGLPAFGTGGGGGGYESSGYNAFVYVRALAGAEGMPGAVIVEAAIE